MIKIVVTGRMVKDLTVVQTQNGMHYTRDARIAGDGRYNAEEKKNDTMYFDVKGFGAIADRMERFLKKGSPTTITGSLQERKFKNQNGEERTVNEIIVDDFTLPPLPPKDNGEVKSNVDENLPEINDADLPF